MHFSTAKSLALIVILSTIMSFNYFFFTSVKEKTDYIYNTYIVPKADATSKAGLATLMKKPLYTRGDLEEMANIGFNAYKENLKGRDLLSDKIKNLVLLNIKTVIYDNNNFYFGLNYLFNLCAFTSFIFILLFKETYTGVRYEPALYTE